MLAKHSIAVDIYTYRNTHKFLDHSNTSQRYSVDIVISTSV